MTDLGQAPRASIVTEELIAAFMRLAKGDFAVRLQRNFCRDSDDILALFVNLIAEELGQMAAAKEAERKKLEDGVTELSEKMIRLASGDFSVRAPRNESGDPLDVLAFMLNNTAAEMGDTFSEVQREGRIVEAILDSMVEGVVLVDSAGTVRRANKAFSELLGYEQTALIARRIGTLLADTEQGLAGRLVTEAQAVRSLDVVFRSAEAEPVPLAVCASALHDEEGQEIGVVLVARDERELRDARAQLQLSDRLTTMGTLAAGVAHEINNPLAFIVSNLDFISEELEALEGGAVPSPEDLSEMQQALRASMNGAQRVRQIVSDLKGLSRVGRESSGKIDLPKLLDSACNMLQNEIRHRAKVVRDFGETPPVEGNEARCLQVFLNLLQNAAHAIPSGEVDKNTIRLVTGERDGGAFVEVRDTGAGIPDSEQKRIFDAFYTTKAAGVGTGLGLSISHKIVAGMGGRIEIESELGEGSVFRVWFPPAGHSTSTAERPVPKAQTSSPRRVLVIDDEKEVLHSLRRILGREHEVALALGGREALSLITAEDWDLILCDLMMPEVNGPEVFRTILDRAPELAVRVVFMTGGSFDQEIRTFLQSVPNGLLEKPFDTQALRALVARLPRAGDSGSLV